MQHAALFFPSKHGHYIQLGPSVSVRKRIRFLFLCSENGTEKRKTPDGSMKIGRHPLRLLAAMATHEHLAIM